MRKSIANSRRLPMVITIMALVVSLVGCNLQNRKIMEGIANRFQVTPSWVAIRKQLFENEFKPGMTKAEVHQILDKVGPWSIDIADAEDQGSWHPDFNKIVYREVIRFTEPNTFAALGIWDFYYDKEGILVDQGPVDTA